MYYYIKDHPLFGENLVNSFISQCLDEFIPDILIDVLKKRGPLVCIALLLLGDSLCTCYQIFKLSVVKLMPLVMEDDSSWLAFHISAYCIYLTKRQKAKWSKYPNRKEISSKLTPFISISL